jgi:hypothetical protein
MIQAIAPGSNHLVSKVAPAYNELLSASLKVSTGLKTIHDRAVLDRSSQAGNESLPSQKRGPARLHRCL